MINNFRGQFKEFESQKSKNGQDIRKLVFALTSVTLHVLLVVFFPKWYESTIKPILSC